MLPITAERHLCRRKAWSCSHCALQAKSSDRIALTFRPAWRADSKTHGTCRSTGVRHCCCAQADSEEACLKHQLALRMVAQAVVRALADSWLAPR